MFSPVPTQTTFASVGSTVTQPIENEPWSSKTGVHDVPAFTVFQTPPTVATNHVLACTGDTAMSMTRPEVTAGPIERNCRPLRVDAVSPAAAAFWSRSAFEVGRLARGLPGGGLRSRRLRSDVGATDGNEREDDGHEDERTAHGHLHEW